MENKKSASGGIHRDGYTWKDSMIVSILALASSAFAIFFSVYYNKKNVASVTADNAAEAEDEE